MGKKYYCDYCDRAFKDTPDARKKHLMSLQHSNNKKNYYKQYKDPETIFIEESRKIPCKKFLINECIFGESCRFSHYTPQMLMELQHIIADRKRSHEILRASNSNTIRQKAQNLHQAEDEDETDLIPSWTYPQELLTYPNLPPSLWPITPLTITNWHFAVWGEDFKKQ